MYIFFRNILTKHDHSLYISKPTVYQRKLRCMPCGFVVLLKKASWQQWGRYMSRLELAITHYEGFEYEEYTELKFIELDFWYLKCILVILLCNIYSIVYVNIIKPILNCFKTSPGTTALYSSVLVVNRN